MIDLGPGEDIPINEEGDAAVQHRSVKTKKACVLKEVKGTLGIHFGGGGGL